jgi:hypothetical protein
MRFFIKKNGIFKNVLFNMRTGNLGDTDNDFLMSPCLKRWGQEWQDEKQTCLKGSIHLVPTWKLANTININHLMYDFDTPIAKFSAKFHSSRVDGRNCCIRESSFPLRNPLCVGARVMLLHNVLVEHKIMNGLVGEVTDICNKNVMDQKMKTDQNML